MNNNQPKPVPAPVKRVRTKTTPLRSQLNIDDNASISISVSLTRLGEDTAELSLTTQEHGKLNYDQLTKKRQDEVKSSLLKDNVWQKMLTHLTKIRPTSETLALFQKILPTAEHVLFMTELRKVWGNSIH